MSSVSVRKGCSVLNASDVAHTFVVSDGPLTSHGKRVKRPAVPAGDGEPLEVGQTVWHEDGTELRVLGFKHEEDGETIVRVEYVSGPSNWSEVRSLSLTHTKPELPDSWERIEEDARGLDSGVDRELFTHTHEDIVRRCRALAERERGE